MTEETRIPTDEEAREEAERPAVMRRIRLVALASWAVFAAWYTVRLEWLSLAGLTASALVVMINFLWLEAIVVRVLQPAPRVRAWRLVVRTLARFILFGVALAAIIIIARINAISVLLGFSVLVIGIMGEACYELVVAVRSGR
jgi:uncharacterized membrane protein